MIIQSQYFCFETKQTNIHKFYFNSTVSKHTQFHPLSSIFVCSFVKKKLWYSNSNIFIEWNKRKPERKWNKQQFVQLKKKIDLPNLPAAEWHGKLAIYIDIKPTVVCFFATLQFGFFHNKEIFAFVSTLNRCSMLENWVPMIILLNF